MGSTVLDFRMHQLALLLEIWEVHFYSCYTLHCPTNRELEGKGLRLIRLRKVKFHKSKVNLKKVGESWSRMELDGSSGSNRVHWVKKREEFSGRCRALKTICVAVLRGWVQLRGQARYNQPFAIEVWKGKKENCLILAVMKTMGKERRQIFHVWYGWQPGEWRRMKNFKITWELKFVTLRTRVRSAHLSEPDSRAMDCPPSENCGNLWWKMGQWTFSHWAYSKPINGYFAEGTSLEHCPILGQQEKTVVDWLESKLSLSAWDAELCHRLWTACLVWRRFQTNAETFKISLKKLESNWQAWVQKCLYLVLCSNTNNGLTPSDILEGTF